MGGAAAARVTMQGSPPLCRRGGAEAVLVSFFRTFFRPHKVTKSVHLPCPTENRRHLTRGPFHFLGPHRAKHRELPAHIGQDLVQLRRVPGEIELPRKWEFQQRRGDGALRSECQQARPPSNPSCASQPPAPLRPGARRASGARWLLRRQNDRRLRHRQHATKRQQRARTSSG